jgi:hypothetical protein
VADIKEKNYEEEEGAGAGAARRGLAWFGLVWFGFFQLTLHNILGEFPRKYRHVFLLCFSLCLVCVKTSAALFFLLRAEVPALLGPPTRCRYTPPLPDMVE